jgi:ribosomal protein S18 acetylase RimI-like enzyme
MNAPAIPAVRRATAGDIEAMLRLESEFPTDRLDRRHLRHLLVRANADVFVLDHAGAAIANAVTLYRRGSRSARLYSLAVAPAQRGRGLGATLLAAAETAASQRGCERIVLEVRPDNAAALRLYRARGYVVTGTRKEFYEDGSEALRLWKHLSAQTTHAA